MLLRCYLCTCALIVSMATAVHAQAVVPGVTFSTVSPTAYATGDINSVAICRNNLTTYGNYQYAAYYGTDRQIYIGRRQTGGIAAPGDWQTRATGISLPTTGLTAITDDHNVVAMGIDGNGYMHLSWGMHNVPLTMADSAAPVDQSLFGAANGSTITFAARASVTGSNESSATYPEFYTVPGSKDLLFFYRDGGPGGGSGNGNEYINRYSAATKQWSKVATPLIQGLNADASLGYNGYLNSVARDSKGNLQMTWTWRESSDFQTNHDILYAKSADNGVTWTKQDGTPYTLGITQATAQLVKSIGQGNSLINQSSMTVDKNDNPILANWYAPKTASRDYARQYFLEYYDGTAWKESQITNFAPDSTITTNDQADIRAVSRPIVLVDQDNRVLVIYRNTADNNNGLTAAYSLDRVNWQFLTLSTQNMGQYEPTYDSALWASKGVLNLFYQPLIISGVSSSPVQVLQWDERAYFTSIPEPAASAALLLGGVMLLRRGSTRPAQKAASISTAL